MYDRLNDREGILEAMCLFVEQHTLPLLPLFPVGDISHTLKCKLAIANRFDLNHCFDSQNSSIFCVMQKLTGPNPFFTQLVRRLFE